MRTCVNKVSLRFPCALCYELLNTYKVFKLYKVLLMKQIVSKAVYDHSYYLHLTILMNCLIIPQIYIDNHYKKLRFSIKNFFNKCDLRIWSHLLNKSLTENFIFCVMNTALNPRCLRNVFWTASVCFSKWSSQ